jgi:hypothetical protein
MKRLTQEAWVRTQLERHGRVSRNIALRRYISRLAARIADLRAGGMNIVGRQVKTKRGKDYVYELVK